jgi:hypothetical protein
VVPITFLACITFLSVEYSCCIRDQRPRDWLLWQITLDTFFINSNWSHPNEVPTILDQRHCL